MEVEQTNERSPLLPNRQLQTGDTDISSSYDSLVPQHSDQQLVKNRKTDLMITEQSRKFIMSPVRQIFCGILTFDMLITFIIWVISWQVLVILLLKIF